MSALSTAKMGVSGSGVAPAAAPARSGSAPHELAPRSDSLLPGTWHAFRRLLSEESAAKPELRGAYLDDCAVSAKLSAQGRDDALADALWDATEARLDAALAKRGIH